jgi:hypothetical protein
MMQREEELIIRIMDARDGKLSRSELVDLMQDLTAYPDLLDSLEDLPELFPELEINFDKTILRKTEVHQVSIYNGLEGSVADKLFIGEVEGLLNDLDAQNLQALKKEGQYLKELKAYQYTKLQPDKRVHFPHKEKLQRKEKTKVVTPLFYLISAAAAGMAVLLYFSVFNMPMHVTHFKADNSQKSELLKSIRTQQGSISKQENIMDSKPTAQKQNTLNHPDINLRIIEDTILVVQSIPSEVSQNNVVEEKKDTYTEEMVFAEISENHMKKPQTSSTTHNGFWAFVRYKLNEKYFGNPKISKHEQLSVLAEKISSQSGAYLAYDKIKSEDEEGFFLRLGSISIERKKAN